MLEGVVDHQGDQLLWELIRAVVIGAPGDVHRQLIGIGISLDEQVRGGLAGGIRAVGIQGSGFHKEALRTQGAVHLVRGNLHELYAILVLVVAHGPGVFRNIQKVDGAQNIGLDENLRIGNGTVHMAFRGKVHHVINVVLVKQALDRLFVTDIRLNKDIIRVAFHALQVFQIAGIGQLVHVDDLNVAVLVQHIDHEVRADKAGAAGD